MLKIYFDEVLIDEDSYTALSNDYKLFTDNFKLGSVASNSFKLSVNKAMVENHPNEVKIEDDNTAFYLVVDSITEDKHVYNYTLTDKLLNFNFNYDASEIINEKVELEETCYLSDIWHDMCNQAGVEYDETYTFLNDIEVSWYDNTIQARKYLSYIAELQGGYAIILPNGKQSFKPYKKASSKTIDIDECSDFILGEKKTITRVVYDTGTIFWTFGDDTGTTLYLDTTNVFITSEEVVENIYDSIVNFEFFMVNVPNATMDSSIRAGDIITFTDGINNYPTIAQYSMSYGGGWIGSYKIQVNTDKQEETKIVGTKEIVKKIESEIDRTNATLKITSEQTEGNTSKISTLQQDVNGFDLKTQEINEVQTELSQLKQTTQDLSLNFQKIGGNNLWPNSSGQNGIVGYIRNMKKPYVEITDESQLPDDSVAEWAFNTVTNEWYNFKYTGGMGIKFKWFLVPRWDIQDFEDDEQWKTHLKSIYNLTEDKMNENVYSDLYINFSSIENKSFDSQNSFVLTVDRTNVYTLNSTSLSIEPFDIVKGESEKLYFKLKYKNNIIYGGLSIIIYQLSGNFTEYGNNTTPEYIRNHILKSDYINLPSSLDNENLFNLRAEITLDKDVKQLYVKIVNGGNFSVEGNLNDILKRNPILSPFITDVFIVPTGIFNTLYKSSFKKQDLNYFINNSIPEIDEENLDFSQLWLCAEDIYVDEILAYEKDRLYTIDTSIEPYKWKLVNYTKKEIEDIIRINFFDRWIPVKQVAAMSEFEDTFKGTVEIGDIMLSFTESEWQPKVGENYWGRNIKFSGEYGMRFINTVDGYTRTLNEKEDTSRDSNGGINWALTTDGQLVRNQTVNGLFKHGPIVKVPSNDGVRTYFLGGD